jgi:transcriptional regulator with XRE-family HTH domain
MRQHITRLRKSRKMTPYRLAKLAGVSRSHLMAIEAGRTDPSVGTLCKIAAALGVPVTELLE